MDEVTLPSCLMIITDRARSVQALPDAVHDAVHGGARWIRVREPDLELFPYIALCHVLIDTVADPRVTWTVRPAAYAILRTAYPELRLTVHCTERDALFSAPDVSVLVGRSVHTAAAENAIGASPPDERRASAHYLLLAPVFASVSKPDAPPAGVEALRALAQRGVAVVALGGVTPQNASSCSRAGARAVAACGYVLNATDPGERVRALLAAWNGVATPD